MPRPQRRIRAYLTGVSAPGKRTRVEQILLSIKGISDEEVEEIFNAWERTRIIRQHLRLVGSIQTITQQLLEPMAPSGSEFVEVNRLLASLRVVTTWHHDRKPYLMAMALNTVDRIAIQIVEEKQRIENL